MSPAQSPYMDTHCHIDLISPEPAQQNLIIEQSRQAGLGLLLNAGVDRSSIQAGWTLAGKYKDIIFAAGYHPSILAESEEPDTTLLKRAAADKKCVAVGEIGLDYFYGKENIKEQRALFDLQLDLACELDMPVIIHSRDAWKDTFSHLSGRDLKGIFHCFSGDPDIVRTCLDMNFMISFAGNLTYPKAENLRKSAVFCPEDRILLETDSPYLAPVPHRGERPNKPEYIRHTYQFLADLKKISLERLCSSIGGKEDLFRRLGRTLPV